MGTCEVGSCAAAFWEGSASEGSAAAAGFSVETCGGGSCAATSGEGSACVGSRLGGSPCGKGSAYVAGWSAVDRPRAGDLRNESAGCIHYEIQLSIFVIGWLLWTSFIHVYGKIN